MPVGEGYFIGPMGELIEVWDHFEFVREHPEMFGFTPAQIKRFFGVSKKKPKAELRQELLSEVLRRDWIRLRVTNEYHFQYWRLDEWTLERIRKALSALTVGEYDVVILGELSRGRHDEVRARDIMSDRAYTWVAGIGEVCRFCKKRTVAGMGLGAIGIRPVCPACDAIPMQTIGAT